MDYVNHRAEGLANDPYEALASAACACRSAQLCLRHLRELPLHSTNDPALAAAALAAQAVEAHYLHLRRRLVGC